MVFGKDARDLLIDCCVEFITLISSEANEISEKESKKTIAPEHIDKALRELGFPEYVREVLASAGDMKESLKVGTYDTVLWLWGDCFKTLILVKKTYPQLHVMSIPIVLIVQTNRHEKRGPVRWIKVA